MIDTAEKRRSAAGVRFGGPGFGPGVTPNAAKLMAWRQEVGRGYSGTPVGGVAVPGPYYVDADSAYAAGAAKGKAFRSGAVEGGAFKAGAVRSQTK